MKFSEFTGKFTSGSGILKLMEDLGDVVKGDSGLVMLGGGNPAHIQEIQDVLRNEMQKVLDSEGEFEHLIGNYDPPEGGNELISALVKMFNDNYGWKLTKKNIALTNGSQSAFFYLFNMFAGSFPDGDKKKILLPIVPEYIGYADLGLEEDIFRGCLPKVVFTDDNKKIFKYEVDFDNLEIDETIGAICVSRPTNPTGNVLSDSEIDRLLALAKENDIPLIVDNAYGLPFPNMIYDEASLIWDENIILSMSLSKFGIPGARTGIVVANEEVISAITNMNAIFNLAPGSLGVTIASNLIESSEIIKLSKKYITPYYKRKRDLAFNYLYELLDGVEFALHKPQGAMFLWLWIKNLPITSLELYDLLKAKGVIVVSGHYFFNGLDEEFEHRDSCIRISYAYSDEMVKMGLETIAEEIKILCK
jgi:valine--pyruvate aminotransferase